MGPILFVVHILRAGIESEEWTAPIRFGSGRSGLGMMRSYACPRRHPANADSSGLSAPLVFSNTVSRSVS